MTGSGDQPDKMAEIAGLAAAIADRILELHEAGRSIQPDQFRMLVRATRMLQDHGVPWPPSVEFLLLEVAKRIEQADAPGEGGNVVVHLTQALDAAKYRADPKRVT